MTVHPTLRWEDVWRRSGKSNPQWMSRPDLHLFLKGRGAMYRALSSLRDSRGAEVLLPAFHCPSVVEPVLRAGYRPHFYAVNRDLSVNVSELLRQVSKNTAAIVLISYFGFPVGAELVREIRDATDCCIIEDWAHSFLRASPVRLVESIGDAAVLSFSKLVPSWAGGGLLVNNPDRFTRLTPLKPLGTREGLVAVKQLTEEMVENAPPGILRSSGLRLEQARVSLRRFCAGPENRDSNSGNSPIESADYFFETQLPWFARRILAMSDLDALVSKRRRNYELLNRFLRESDHIKKVFPCLPEDVCPWAYPVLVKDRSRWDRVLRSVGVPVFTFGETLHPKLYESDSSLLENACYLSESLLLVSIHQNLEAETVQLCADRMNRMLAVEQEVGSGIGQGSCGLFAGEGTIK